MFRTGNNPDNVFVNSASPLNGDIYVLSIGQVYKYAPGSTVGTVVVGAGPGTGLNQLNSPNTIFVTLDRAIYISDRGNHRIMKWLDSATQGILVAGVTSSSGSALNQLDNPLGIFVDTQDNIYIAERYNHRITKWTSNYAAGGTVVAGGPLNGLAYGSGPTQLNQPYGVFVDAAGSVYIADTYNHRIQKWRKDATSGTTVPGTVSYPNSVWVNLGVPSTLPTRQPSAQPTGQPSSQPTGHPSAQPTGQPSAQPSAQPTKPSLQPTILPSRPTVGPTVQPTTRPSTAPLIFVTLINSHVITRFVEGDPTGFVVAGVLGTSGLESNKLNTPLNACITSNSDVYICDNRCGLWPPI